jgi:FemAB-related protein (PEP-CTERM system-associated)
LDSWSGLVREIYKHSIYRFEALQDDEIVGVLVLAHIRHPVFGHYLATSPFGSYGGFAFTSLDARNALLEEARKLTSELGVEYTVIRFLRGGDPPPDGWIQNPIYSTYLVDLPAQADGLWNTFGPQHRKHTRQSLRKGFTVRFGRLELLDDTYEAMSRSMHELGSPYHLKKYLKRMATILGDNLEFVVLRDSSGKLAGASVLVYQGGVASTLHANILQKFRPDYAGECLYWSVLEHCCEKGMRVCDLGRSLNGSGNETFKLKWHPRKEPLSYWYYLPQGGPIPELNQKSPKFQFAIRVWKMLPAFLVHAMGPFLIGGIA